MKKYAKFFALTAAVLLFSCGGAFAAVQIRVAHAGSTEHQYQIALEQFKKLVEERSGKEITVQIFPSGQLGSERDAIEGVRMGTMEMTTISAGGALPSFVPETAIFGLPYVLHTRKQVAAVYSGPFGQKMTELVNAKGFINLDWWEMGFKHFTNNTRPIKTPADLKGLKIRVMESKGWMELIKLLGGIPTPIAFGELYSSLQQKVVDGEENPISTIYSSKFYEVQKYLSLDAHTYEPTAVLANPKWFNALSAEHQKIIKEAALEAGKFQVAKLEQLEQERLEVIKKAGTIVEEHPDIEAFVEITKGFEKNLDNVPAELVALLRSEAAKAPK
ncbi:MAG: DctP family TRAP transporter solute-binding subunit [Synergistaceae bacterium]|jgi:tripartite ATP-independent transporter DctP family solute receptor|nr:DctP family TRAP transporter solute-binding subunit [Synergistaceae bacterium]